MKIIANIIKSILILALAAVVAVVGCFAAVFFISKETPDDIFILDYALVLDTDSNGKPAAWFIKKADNDSLETGDGVLYYNGKYCFANAMVTDYGTQFYTLDDLTLELNVSNENIVGEVIAMWQQK